MKKIISFAIATLIAFGTISSVEAKTSKKNKSSRSHKTEQVSKKSKKKSTKSASTKKTKKSKTKKTAKKGKSKHSRSVSSGDWKYTKASKNEIGKTIIDKKTRLKGEKLHVGMQQSLEVAKVQAALVFAGYLPQYRVNKRGEKVTSVDGYFGPNTVEPLQKLQDRYNIKARGRFVLHYTTRVVNYILATNGKLPPQAEFSVPKLANIHSTHYNAGETHSDRYTDKRKSATGDRLNMPSIEFAGSAGTDPEIIEWGSLILVQTLKGTLAYIASDTGTAVIDQIASRGHMAIVDFYGTTKIVGMLTIVHYEGVVAYQDLPSKVRTAMYNLSNWRGYTFVMPNGLHQFDNLIAKR